VLSDNGLGAHENSADYLLRVYRIAPDFRSRRGGAGTIEIRSFFTLHDPDRKLGFPIVADSAHYPGGAIAVDSVVRVGRLLTGADLDPESFREAPDGTLWFGDEFGPFLIHTDRTGKLLDPPYRLPGVMSPQNPFLGWSSPNLPRSRGFEGMALAPDGKTLYVMLEGALTTEPDPRRLQIHEFDLRKRRFTGKQWRYRMADTTAGQVVGDLTAVSDRNFILIERDDRQGADAAFKKVFLVNLDETDAAGFLVKREVADLLQLDDPDGLGGQGRRFRFALQSVEALVVLGPARLGVLNDNNYPFSQGRVPGEPDPSEFIVIGLDRPLPGVQAAPPTKR
jgi:hypothetical protein